MLSSLRKRVTFARVLMTVAAVFAMTGGAYAAGKYVITSTKQISPKVLKQLKGKTGAAGPTGATGPAGPAGPTGPAGASGSAGEKGAAGEPGAPGEKGPQGATGAPGVAGESVTSATLKAGEEGCAEGGSKFTVGGKTTTACAGAEGKQGPTGATGPQGPLQPGKAEMGQWAFGQKMTTEGGEPILVAMSFPVPLAKALEAANVHYIGVGEGEGEENPSSAITEHKCSGTVEKPGAASGNLCVFTARIANYTKLALISIPFEISSAESGETGAGVSGAYLVSPFDFTPAEAGYIAGSGDWVVTG